MRIGIIGSSNKTNLVLAMAVAVSNLKDTPTVIKSLHNQEYDYLPNNVNGVEFGLVMDTMEFWDSLGEIPACFESTDKVFLVVDGSAMADSLAQTIYSSVDVDGVIYLGPESKNITKLYTGMFKGVKVYYMLQDYVNLNSISRYGKVRFKTLNSDFLDGLSDLMVDHFDASDKDLKQLWTYLRKRG